MMGAKHIRNPDNVFVALFFDEWLTNSNSGPSEALSATKPKRSVF